MSTTPTTGSEPCDLDAIEARAAAATPGPWLAGSAGPFGDAVEPHEVVLSGALPLLELTSPADAEFIAHARPRKSPPTSPTTPARTHRPPSRRGGRDGWRAATTLPLSPASTPTHRRTPTMADYPCDDRAPHGPHTRREPGRHYDGAWCPGAPVRAEDAAVTVLGVALADGDRRREWAAALRYAAAEAARPYGGAQDGELDSTDLRDLADQIEAGATPWAPQPPAAPPEPAHQRPADPDAGGDTPGSAAAESGGPGWDRDLILGLADALDQWPGGMAEPGCRSATGDQLRALVADRDRRERDYVEVSEQLASELADERTLHQATMQERDAARAEADQLRAQLADPLARIHRQEGT